MVKRKKMKYNDIKQYTEKETHGVLLMLKPDSSED
jgi:hypothetical protein